MLTEFIGQFSYDVILQEIKRAVREEVLKELAENAVTDNMNQETVTKEATEKEEGDRYRECLICGQRDHDVIPKLGLSVITVVIIVAGIVTALGGAVFAAYRLVYKKKNITVETDEDEWIFS